MAPRAHNFSAPEAPIRKRITGPLQRLLAGDIAFFLSHKYRYFPVKVESR
jgi:hypothetical protein